MTAEDRDRWNARYRQTPGQPTTLAVPACPAGFSEIIDLLPTMGQALDVACGVGAGAVWFAMRGLVVEGIDASDVAIQRATQLAAAHGVDDRCRFTTSDLDAGLPAGPQVDLLVCHLFSARSLDDAMVKRLTPGGVLAITVLSEVGGEAGPFSARPGELIERFGRLEQLDVRHHHEANGTATLVGFAAGPQPHGRLD